MFVAGLALLGGASLLGSAQRSMTSATARGQDAKRQAKAEARQAKTAEAKALREQKAAARKGGGAPAAAPAMPTPGPARPIEHAHGAAAPAHYGATVDHDPATYGPSRPAPPAAPVSHVSHVSDMSHIAMTGRHPGAPASSSPDHQSASGDRRYDASEPPPLMPAPTRATATRNGTRINTPSPSPRPATSVRTSPCRRAAREHRTSMSRRIRPCRFRCRGAAAISLLPLRSRPARSPMGPRCPASITPSTQRRARTRRARPVQTLTVDAQDGSDRSLGLPLSVPNLATRSTPRPAPNEWLGGFSMSPTDHAKIARPAPAPPRWIEGVGYVYDYTPD